MNSLLAGKVALVSGSIRGGMCAVLSNVHSDPHLHLEVES